MKITIEVNGALSKADMILYLKELKIDDMLIHKITIEE